MSWGGIGVAVLVGALVFIGVLVVLTVPRRDRLRRTLNPHLVGASPAGDPTAFDAHRPGGLEHLTVRVLRRLNLYTKLDLRLKRAGWSMSPVRFTWFSILIAVGFALLLGVIGAPVILVIAGLLFGGYLLSLILGFKADRRSRAFEQQLPEFLNNWTALLKAGHSLRQAIESTARDGVPPASDEFSNMLRRVNIGLPMEDALDQLGERMDSRDLDFVVTATSIQREIGGSMANFLELVSDTVRERQYLARRMRALTAVGRQSAVVLISMPFILWAVLTLINPSYMHPLFHTTAGVVMVTIALVLLAIGGLTLKRIVSAEDY